MPSTATLADSVSDTARSVPWLDALVLCFGMTAALLVEPTPAGFYHDDGVYVATGDALRSTGEYRLINLPTTPLQTKYVPGYPALLAVVGALVAPDVALYAFRLANCVLYVVTLLVMARLIGSVPGVRLVERGLLLAVCAITPGTLTYTDFVLSETLFLTLVALTFWCGMASTSWAATGVAAALAVMTRPAGIALVPALWWMTRERPIRDRIWAVGLPLVAVAAWWGWRQWVAAPHDLVLDYYTRYEPSLYGLLLEEPSFGLETVGHNARTLNGMIGLVMGPTAGLLLAPLVVATVAAAVRGQGAALLRPMLGFAIVHHLVVLGHPFPMARYLIPWTLVLPVALAAVIGQLRSAAQHGSVWRLGQHAGLVLAALVLLGDVAALRIYGGDRDGRVHAEFGFTTAFGWNGFLETADWIEQHTPQGAVLGSGYDTFYYLEAGRRGVRPWIHVPSTLLEFTERIPDVHTRRAVVRSSVEALGITHLVIDPMLGSRQGRYATAELQGLLDDPAFTWELRFTSADGLHRVYARAARR